MIGLVVTTALCFGAACGGNPEVSNDEPHNGGSGGAAGSSGNGGFSGTLLIDGGGSGSSGDAGTGVETTDRCAGQSCTPGQRCVANDAGVSCVNNTCADLTCKASERCEPHPQGGSYCKDLSCTTDVQCPASEFCDGTLCKVDVCTPGQRTCSGQAVLECTSNGGQRPSKFTCGSPAYFTSQCQSAAGNAYCPCEDDWDCPANTVCEVNRCTGTGKAPTCTLPPEPFTNMKPAVELHWGGDSPASPNAHDGTGTGKAAPWPTFSQVLDTPLVANLDDDNGDGLINELDFPEIIFESYKGDNPWSNGVLRAIHGGGRNKGRDYFARCATKLWTEAAPTSDTCADADPDGDSSSPAAIADLDYDGIPEILYTTESNTFRILDNKGGLIYTLATAWANPTDGETISVANLDHKGFAEIIVGRNVYVLGKNASNKLIVTHILSGTKSSGENEFSMMTCPADLVSTRAGLELVAGATLYALPATIPACATPPCTGTLDVVWNAKEIAGQTDKLTGEGFCAVADVWGANAAVAPGPTNPPDAKAEVVLIDNGRLKVLNGQTGALILDKDLGGGTRGGAPNVDDFDGDGYMEIASALQDFYIVIDLQASTGAAGICPDWPSVIPRSPTAANPNPARSASGRCTNDSQCAAGTACNETLGVCVCLHNGWKRDSDDDSSRATSSSVFDFNGDGAAEVLYNDECDFRVYDGRTGAVLSSQKSRSRTGIENPVVADVDNDGNAEVVTIMNTEQWYRCDDDPGGVPTGPNGLRVWGDPDDQWVSARRIWNEQSYHVTNVLERGGVPLHEPENFRGLNGRFYNTYRSQPRSYGVAPDLTVVAVGVSSPNVACGTLSDTLEISFEVKNQGDLRVGPGVPVTFVGTWGTTQKALVNASGQPLSVVLVNSLEPGSSFFSSVGYKASYNAMSALPDKVRVVIDGANSQRECNEHNNFAEAPVQAGGARADLRIALGLATTACPSANVVTTVFNHGSLPASRVLVRYYAGDPAQGGGKLYEETIAGPIAAGQSVQLTPTIPGLPADRTIIIYGAVDPDDAIDECNEANNQDAADDAVTCSSIAE